MQSWEKFIDPQIMQDRLISSSLFIAAFESLKNSIVNRVKQFYQAGFGIGGDKLDPEYKTEVLARNSSLLYASLDWLKEHEAIDQNDIMCFDKVKLCRNRLSHTLFSMIGEDDMPDIKTQFEMLIALLRKVEVWWVVNVEIPCNPDFDNITEIDEDEIHPGPVWLMQMMVDIATGKTDYINQYREHFKSEPVDSGNG